MKKIFLMLIICVLFFMGINAQKVITVQNGNSTFLYNNLDSAITYAQNDDTIYIPGGIFNLYYNHLSKKVTIIGVGHNPDSSLATGITYISNSLYFVDSSSGSSLTGIYLSGSIFFTYGQNSQPPPPGIDNIFITRCNIGNIFGNYDGTGYGGCCACVSNSQIDNFVIAQNIIRGSITGLDGNSNVVTNNLIEGSIVSIGQNIYSNNIFLVLASCPYYCNAPTGRIQNAVVENNIFITLSTTVGVFNICGGGAYSSNCRFSNNLIVENIASPYCSNCLDYNNYIGVDATNIFIDQSGNTFSYNQNYHLKNPLLHMGTDGTQVGIYGGTFPWKEGSIPSNPHVSSKSIDSKNDANGNIRMRIKVKAQSN